MATIEKKDGTAPATTEQASALQQENPFRFMRRFAEEMDQLFNSWPWGNGNLPEHRPSAGFTQFGTAAWAPEIEVEERDGTFAVRADLPGMKKEDVKVELNANRMILKGERRQESEEKKEGYFRSERRYGSFYRSIPLPEGVDTNKARASFREGVLEITMPTPKQETKTRTVAID